VSKKDQHDQQSAKFPKTVGPYETKKEVEGRIGLTSCWWSNADIGIGQLRFHDGFSIGAVVFLSLQFDFIEEQVLLRFQVADLWNVDLIATQPHSIVWQPEEYEPASGSVRGDP
jgi:hypothetical protein